MVGCLPFGVPTGAEVGRAALAILLTLAKMDGIPCLLVALLLCSFDVAPEYAFICDFKGVF